MCLVCLEMYFKSLLFNNTAQQGKTETFARPRADNPYLVPYELYVIL